MTKRDPLAERARRRFAGERAVGLAAEEIRANVLRGQGAKNRWPLNAVETSPVAKALAEATRRVTSIDDEGV